MEEKENILTEEITENSQIPESVPLAAEQPEPCVDDDIRTSEKKSTGQKRFLKWTGIVAVILVPVLILVLVFTGANTGTKTASSYEDAVEMVCEALEDGDQKQIEKLLFDREPMEDGELDSLFEDLEHYYGKGYTVACEDVQLVDKLGAEAFGLVNRACEIICWEKLQSEISVTGDTLLGEVAEKYELYEKVMSYSSEKERIDYLANRYGASYPVDTSRFEDCEAYYVRAKVTVSGRDRNNEDIRTVTFTVICRDGEYFIDRTLGAGITMQYVGSGYLYDVCKDALLSDTQIFKLENYTKKEAKLSTDCVEDLLDAYETYEWLIGFMTSN